MASRLLRNLINQLMAATVMEESIAGMRFSHLCGYGRTQITTASRSQTSYTHYRHSAFLRSVSITKSQDALTNLATSSGIARRYTTNTTLTLGAGRGTCSSGLL